jgi:DNA-binding NarL/FixJ family response regulator
MSTYRHVEHEPATAATSAPLRVAAADDSLLIREAIASVLRSSDRIDLVALCDDGASLWAAIEEELPDVVLVDIRMPPSGDHEGISIAARLRHERPDIGLVALSQYSDPELAVALLRPSAQGRGYLLKDRLGDRNELIEALEVVARGGSVIDPVVVEQLIAGAQRPPRSPIDELTPREREVLSLMARGKSNRAIADDLTLTKRAVEKHVGSIFMKLMLDDEEIVSRRVAAVLMYLAGTAQPAVAEPFLTAAESA